MIFFLLIILIIVIFNTMLLLSRIVFEIEELKLTNILDKEHIKTNYKIIISLKILNKIKWINLKIDKNKFMKWKESGKIKVFDKLININVLKDLDNLPTIIFKNRQEVFTRSNLKKLKKLKPEVEKFILNVDLDTENAIKTSYIVAFLYSIISLILANLVKEYRKENIKYQIKPCYVNKDILNIELNCIINVKMVHIINIIYSFKRSVDKNDRTSNRRAYDNSYEQHTRYGRC